MTTEANASGTFKFLTFRRLIVFAVVAAVILLGGLFTLSALSAIRTVSREANVARDELQAGAGIVEAGGSGLPDSQISLARRDFSSAEAHFAAAETILNHSFVFRLGKVLPVISTQVKAADELSDMGVHLSRVGDLGAQALSAATRSRTISRNGGPGAQIIDMLDTVEPIVAKAQSEVASAASDRNSIPSTGLVGQLHNAVVQLDRRLNIGKVRSDLVRIRSMEPALKELLGAYGPRTFLVLEQDSAELRATGGLIGSVGFLSFNHGRMAPFEPEDIAAVERNPQGQTYGFGNASTGVRVPAPLAKAFPLVTSLSLRDSNWSPDFPTSARQAEALLQIEAHKKVDGVIAIDPYFMESILSVTGPVKVPETGDVVDSTNFFSTTLNRVELNQSVGRKSYLAQVAKAVFAKFLTASSRNALALAQVLGSACQARSVQAYFHDQVIENFANDYNCGGEVLPLRGDGLMVIDSNLGGNKDDFWLQRKFTLGIMLQRNGNAVHTLQIHYSGLTPHDIHLTQYRGYTGWLRVYVPGSASMISVTGAQLTQATELGRHVFEGWVFVPFYKDVDVTIAYSVSGDDLHASPNSFQFFWQKQAGRPADPIVVNFTPPPGSKLKPIKIANDPVHATIVTSDLSVDRQITFEYSAS